MFEGEEELSINRNVGELVEDFRTKEDDGTPELEKGGDDLEGIAKLGILHDGTVGEDTERSHDEQFDLGDHPRNSLILQEPFVEFTVVQIEQMEVMPAASHSVHGDMDKGTIHEIPQGQATITSCEITRPDTSKQ